MLPPQSLVLPFPAMLHGLTGAIRRKVREAGLRWARDYLKTGDFALPRQMREVPPGEVLFLHSGTEFDITPRPLWRVHMLDGVFMGLNDGVSEEARPVLENAFEAFCLSTPWGALYYSVCPPPPRGAARMARRLAALLRFWDLLQGPRYVFWSFDRQDSLEELVKDLYGPTLKAWCADGSVPVREHLFRMVERMAHATRQECEEVVLRVVPELVAGNAHLKHREALGDPGFQRERLARLAHGDFEEVSSGYKYAVNGLVYAWDRELGRQ